MTAEKNRIIRWNDGRRVLSTAFFLITVSFSVSADIRAAWKNSPGSMGAAVEPGEGFSFQYGNKPMGPLLGDGWKQSTSTDSAKGVINQVFTHSSGLEVTRQTRVFPQVNAVEYKLILKNTSLAPLPAISNLDALDLSLKGDITQDMCVVASDGGLPEQYLPPRTFAIRKQCFSPTVPQTSSMGLGSKGGRSSFGDLPFFFVHNEARQEGLFVAFGWSGQWEATLVRNARGSQYWGPTLDRQSALARTLRVSGRIPNLEVVLEPGEKIDGPTILVGLYRGALAQGSNQLRRLIRDVYTPKLAGKPFFPIAAYSDWWHIGLNFDEALLKTLADRAAAAGEEYFILDPGWTTGVGAPPDDWVGSVGNWFDINRDKFPHGLKPMTDYIRAKGMKVGLFFEPERVAPGSHLAKEHPDWVLWDTVQERNPDLMPLAEFMKGHGLLDYGRPEVRAWVIDMLSKYIKDYDVRYIRHDFNLNPLAYWDAHDKPNRRGMTQLRYIEGLYAVIDAIRERYPDVVLEDISSGGLRIDLEMIKRFHTAWVSDETVDPAIMRFHLSGINYFLPANYAYVQYTLPMPAQENFQPDDLGFQSLFGGEFGFGGPIHLWSADMQSKARSHVEVWKTLRRYLVEDYYPLSAQPGDLESWSGWQFHDPKDASGFVQTFRTRTVEGQHRFVLHGLDNRTRYRFTDAYSRHSFDMTGLKATTQGIEVDQQPMSSKVFTYRKVSDAKAVSDRAVLRQ